MAWWLLTLLRPWSTDASGRNLTCRGGGGGGYAVCTHWTGFPQRLENLENRKSWNMKNWAVNKKKSVSYPAGGRNYGQSGGRNFFFSISFFFSLVGKYCPFLEKKNKIGKNEKKKKKVPSRPFF